MKREIESKICQICQKQFDRERGKYSDVQWLKKKFCSRKCFGVGHSETMSGKVPWNKGVRMVGDEVCYHGLHLRIRKLMPPPKRCSHCKRVKKLDLANISQKYKEEISDWEYLCRKCHMTKDGRISTWRKHSKIVVK